MPLGINNSKSVATNDTSAKKNSTDADDAEEILAQMKAKEDNGDCAFC
jgi:hypothetical protein